MAILCAAFLAASASILRGAEFQAITAEMVAENSFFSWHQPVISLSAMSGDGSTIAVGIQTTGIDYGCASFVCGVGTFLWSLDEPSSALHLERPTPLHFPNGSENAYPISTKSLTYDGQVALVLSEYRHYEAVLYRDGQPQLLRPMIETNEKMWGAGISSDGGSVVGNLGTKPFRWTQPDGLRTIEGLPEEYLFTATAVSGDGNVVVIDAQPGFTHGDLWPISHVPLGNAHTWSESTGLSELRQLAGDQYSHAAAASHDGNTVVGTSIGIPPEQRQTGRAVRWAGGEVIELNSLEHYSQSSANDVSADGEFVVGTAFSDLDLSAPKYFGPLPYDYPNRQIEARSRAVLWNGDSDVFDLYDLLVNRYGLGAQLEGWKLTSASHISDNGLVIAGIGLDPSGNRTVWVANLAVPEPGVIALLFGAAAILPFRYRSGRCGGRVIRPRIGRFRR